LEQTHSISFSQRTVKKLDFLVTCGRRKAGWPPCTTQARHQALQKACS